MTLTFADQRLLLEALDMAAGRHRSQAKWHTRLETFSAGKIEDHENKATAMLALATRLSALKPRHDVLQIA